MKNNTKLKPKILKKDKINNECSIDDGYFENKALSNIFRCVECNDIPYPCYTIIILKKFICGKCKILNQYKKYKIEKEFASNYAIGKNVIKCLNNSDKNNYKSCNWKGLLNAWKKHNNVKCQYSLIVCEYCKSNRILRKNREAHYNVCQQYPIKCSNKGCNKTFERCDEKKHNDNDCQYASIECDHKGCNEYILRKDYTKHQNKCPKRMVSCEYKQYGCNLVMTFDKLDEHLKIDALKHCGYLKNALENQVILKNNNELKCQNELLKKKDEEIKKLKTQLQELNGEIERKKSKSNDKNKEIRTLKDTIKIKDAKIDKLDIEFKREQSLNDDLQQKITELKASKTYEIAHHRGTITLASDVEHTEIQNYILDGEYTKLTTTSYNRYQNKGGTLLLTVMNDIILMNGAKIILNGLGYKGGIGKYQGSSYLKCGIQSSYPNNGGGGSGFEDMFCNIHNAGGGGYGTNGGGFSRNKGLSYGSRELTRLHLGSGGGGGFEDGYHGGSGGGALKLQCNKLIINKNCGIYCNGNDGNGFGKTSKSGGGSGGSIHIICNELINHGEIHAKGGKGNGFGGGCGRIRIDCDKITKRGNITPNHYNEQLRQNQCCCTCIIIVVIVEILWIAMIGYANHDKKKI